MRGPSIVLRGSLLAVIAAYQSKILDKMSEVIFCDVQLKDLLRVKLGEVQMLTGQEKLIYCKEFWTSDQ